MAEINIPKIANLYAPLLFENEVYKFSGRDGNYVMDFRAKTSDSEVLIRQMGSFMAEGLPMARLDSAEGEAYLEIQDRVLPYKIPRINEGSVKRGQALGDVIHHVSGDDARFQYMYTDLLLEHILDSSPTMLKDGQPVKLNMSYSLLSIPGVHLRITNGIISGYSDILQEEFRRYFSIHSDRYNSPDFNTNVDRVSLTELFGAEADRNGVSGVVLHYRGGSWRYTAVPNLTSLKVGYQIPGAVGVEEGYLYFSSKDPNLEAIHTTLTTPKYLEIVKDGGGTTTITSNVTSKPPDVTVTNYNNNKHITGTGTAGKTLIGKFPDGKTSMAVVQASGWSMPWPTGSEYTADQLQKVVLEYSETAYSSSSQAVTSIEATTRLNYGLPVLKLTNMAAPGSLLNPARPSLGIPGLNTLGYGVLNSAHNVVTFPIVEGSKYYTEVISVAGGFKENVKSQPVDKYLNKYFLFGLGVGRARMGKVEKNNSRLGMYLMSYSGAVIQTVSATLLLNISIPLLDEDPNSKVGSNKTAEQKANITYELLSVGFGKVPPVTRKMIPNPSFRWTNHTPYAEKLRITSSWLRNWDASRYRFTTTWRNGVTKTKKSFKFSAKWVSKRPRKVKEPFMFRWKKNLPEVETKKFFYVFSWENNKRFVRNYKLSTTWNTDRPKVVNKAYKFKWNTNLTNPVHIVPYYVRQYDDVTGQWEHMVSYQVYGSEAHLNQYILDNKLFFYFSNPTKFEIIKFDYNMLPYGGINMITLEDDVLNDRTDVPEKYVLIGNYTIKGIEVHNSLSLDVVGGDEQLNEARSYWLPVDIDKWELNRLTQFSDYSERYVFKITKEFRDQHHEDVVELDLIILNQEECCFIKSTTASRCSPY